MVGAGVRVGDLPDYAGHNDLGTAALLAAMHEAGVDRLVLASSMVVYGEGRYTCPEHGDQAPPPRARRGARRRATSRTTARSAARPLGWALVDEARPARPAQRRTPRARSRRSTTPSAWVRQADAAAVALRYHNVYGPGMPRDTPYSGVAAMFRSSLERGEAPQVFEDGGQMRDFVHVADVARANVAALERRGRRRAPAATTPTTSAPADPVAILDVARAGGAPGTGRDVAPEVTGGYRLGDVRHIVASPGAGPRRARLHAPRCGPSDGLREFATAPLRA